MIEKTRSAPYRRLLCVYAPLGLFAAFALFPVYHMLLTSVKTDRALYDLSLNPLMVSLGALTAEHYRLLFKDTLFPTWLLNSLLVSLASTGIAMGISTLAAYGLTRIRFRGADAFGIVIFITYLVPSSLLFLP